MISVEEQEVHMMSNEIVWYGGYMFVTGARVMGSSTPSLRILIFTSFCLIRGKKQEKTADVHSAEFELATY
jgi:hypothetical protein